MRTRAARRSSQEPVRPSGARSSPIGPRAVQSSPSSANDARQRARAGPVPGTPGHDFGRIALYGEPRPHEVHRLAREGTVGNFAPLPHLNRIQQSFGPAHDLSGVRAYVGGAAEEASRTMGARAFAVGEQVAFGARPSLHVAAHEAAHVVQQRQGVRLRRGVGRALDAYERQADQVAGCVVHGQSAADVLPAPTAGLAAPQSGVQMFAAIAGENYDLLSDDGKMAVEDHTRNAWALRTLFDTSNKVLAEIKSAAEIEEISGSDEIVTPPGTSSTLTLTKFRMVDRGTATEAELPDDCGDACSEMLGSNAAGFKSFVARNRRGTTEEFTQPSTYQPDDLAPGGIVSTTERLSGEIYVRIMDREFGLTLGRVDAARRWFKLGVDDPAKQEELAKKYGINQFAVPSVGQGITIGSERDVPGGGVDLAGTSSGYNFHFALNLISSGHDYITLEDYHLSGVKYYFDMYGPESKGQSFAEGATNINALGAKTTTMVVQHPESLKGSVNTDKVRFEFDPAKPKKNRTLSKGDKVTIIRKGHSWMKVEVTSGSRTGEKGWILNRFFTDD